MKLRLVRYQCGACDGVQELKFAPDYVPFRNWLMTCLRCGTYTLLRAISGRAVTGIWR